MTKPRKGTETLLVYAFSDTAINVERNSKTPRGAEWQCFIYLKEKEVAHEFFICQ